MKLILIALIAAVVRAGLIPHDVVMMSLNVMRAGKPANLLICTKKYTAN
jgi:hypothetical protein